MALFVTFFGGGKGVECVGILVANLAFEQLPPSPRVCSSCQHHYTNAIYYTLINAARTAAYSVVKCRICSTLDFSLPYFLTLFILESFCLFLPRVLSLYAPCFSFYSVLICRSFCYIYHHSIYLPTLHFGPFSVVAIIHV